MSAENVGPGKLIWSGEHWISYLRPKKSENNTGLVSLYYADYSPAGHGTAAYVNVPGTAERSEGAGLKALCTDNRDFASFVDDQMIRNNTFLKNSPWRIELPTLEAQFTRHGDVRKEVGWTIETDKHQIDVSWSNLRDPIVAPPTVHPQIVFTILFFADDATISLNGKKVQGDPYLNPAWSQSLGAPQSSCVFALAETMIAG